ncbi:MAG: tetratricopeptide repeat protein [Actinomycetota bacterium]|nr:tetratricopeptide repeat protein [Actinomycetota bacterium]
MNQAEEHFNRGRILSVKGLYQEAIAEYKKALQIDPDYSQGRTNLGLIYWLKGLGKSKDNTKVNGKSRTCRLPKRVWGPRN